MLTYLPVGMDGSCNGLQNFSAMLCDPIGAKATNLAAGAVPSDIYREVAAKCTELLQGRSDELGEVWKKYVNHVHAGVLPRGLAKRPVMTLPYGSTQDSCKQYVYAFLVEENSSFIPKDMRFKLAVYLTPDPMGIHAARGSGCGSGDGLDQISCCCVVKEEHTDGLVVSNRFPSGYG